MRCHINNKGTSSLKCLLLFLFSNLSLYQVADDALAIAGQIVDDGNLYHRVGTGLLLHAGASNVDKYLGGKCGVVDLHVELEELVVGLATYTLANEVYTMTYIVECINALYLEDVSLVACEVGVSLDSCGYLVKLSALLQLNVYHTTMDALAYGDGQRESVLDASL